MSLADKMKKAGCEPVFVRDTSGRKRSKKSVFQSYGDNQGVKNMPKKDVNNISQGKEESKTNDIVVTRLKESIARLSQSVSATRHVIISEEHTKMAYIVPLLLNLGWDVYNPMEVVPEYTCDVGTKKGEKVDYALLLNNKPMLIVEAKDCRASLGSQNYSQLYRYYTTTEAKIAILTNGVEYKFYTDSIRENIMDSEPFFVFNVLDYGEKDIKMLAKFHKSSIESDGIMPILQDMQLDTKIQEFKNWLKNQGTNPSSQFVSFVQNNVFYGTFPLDLVSTVITEVLGGGKGDSSRKIQEAPKQIVQSAIKTGNRAMVVEHDDDLTGIYNYEDLLQLDPPKITLIGIKFGDSKWYECSFWYDTIASFIEYAFSKGYSSSEIIKLDDALEPDLLRDNNFGMTMPYEVRGVWFDKNANMKTTIIRTMSLAELMGLTKLSVKFAVCSRKNKKQYIKSVTKTEFIEKLESL